MDATPCGQHGVSVHSEVLYGARTLYPEVECHLGNFASQHNVVIDVDGVHYDHDLGNDDLDGLVHQ